MKDIINIIGKTTDDKYVINGLFKVFDTMGTPLYVMFELCKNHNWVPSWFHFYDEAYNHGWKHKTIINRLREGMTDVYDTEFISNVMEKLNVRYG